MSERAAMCDARATMRAARRAVQWDNGGGYCDGRLDYEACFDVGMWL